MEFPKIPYLDWQEISRSRKKWCGRGDLNPHAFRRHPLKMVCLPVPPLPQRGRSIIAKGVSILDDGSEGFRVQAGAADQSSVNFFFSHEGFDVFWFHRTAIQDAKLSCEIVAEGLRSL